MICPYCGHDKAWKNGHRNGQQRRLCKNCGRESLEPVSDKAINRAAPNFLVAVEGEKHAERLVGAQNGTEKEEGELEKCQGIQNSDLLKAFPQGIQAEILRFIAHRENNNKQYVNILYSLKSMVKHGADLRDPESVKATLKKMLLEESTKKAYADAYECFLTFMGGTWEKPKYEITQKQYFIPLETELDQLIAGLPRMVSTLCQILKETGASKMEALWLTWEDVDFEKKTIRINRTTKGHATRTIKVTDKCLGMIKMLPKRGDRLFINAESMTKSYYKRRRSLVCKLNNPRLLNVGFHTFRHWVGTTEYHKTRSLGHVAQKLGHKKWENAQIYVSLEEVYFDSQPDEFYTEVADNPEKARRLFEAGWEFTGCEYNGVKIFKKRK